MLFDLYEHFSAILSIFSVGVLSHSKLNVSINLLNSFRLYGNLMMVLSRSAAVSTFNSGYDRPLATDGWVMQHAVDLDSVSFANDLKKQRTGYIVKVQPGFIPSASKYQKKYSLSFLRLENFCICDSCISKKSVLTKRKNRQWTFSKPKKQKMSKMSSNNNYRLRCQKKAT